MWFHPQHRNIVQSLWKTHKYSYSSRASSKILGVLSPNLEVLQCIFSPLLNRTIVRILQDQLVIFATPVFLACYLVRKTAGTFYLSLYGLTVAQLKLSNHVDLYY